MPCCELKRFSQAPVAIDGSRFKTVNTGDRHFTESKVDTRQKEIQESIQRSRHNGSGNCWLS
jgi:hypothetical protein